MSWFRKSLVHDNSFYTAITPEEYYEWKFTETIPKGTLLSHQLPSSKIFNRGLVVVSTSTVVPPECLVKSNNNSMRVTKDTRAEILFNVGQILSPRELIDKHRRLADRFNSELHSFQLHLLNKKYITGGAKKPDLYRVSEYDDNNISMSNFGALEEVLEGMVKTQVKLAEHASHKHGRAYEMADSIKFNQLINLLKQGHLPVDSVSMDFLINTSNIKPSHTKKISWKECYTEIVPEAQSLHTRINDFHNLKWVQSAK